MLCYHLLKMFLEKKYEPKKTNAARFLDALKLAYEMSSYAVDEEDLSAAHAIGVDGGGGCSPLAMKKPYPTFIDASIHKHEKFMSVVQLHLASFVLIEAT